ncbi:MAG: hypothetical protein ACO21B_12300, partial [Gemmobacter sp.]
RGAPDLHVEQRVGRLVSGRWIALDPAVAIDDVEHALALVVRELWRTRGSGFRARLSTGGAIVTGAAYGAVAAEMVDMETFAVVRAAMAHGIPCVGLRGIADGPGDLHGLADWTALLGHLDAELARALDTLIARLVAGHRIGAP